MFLPPLDQPVFIPSRELENNTKGVQRSTREWKTLETSKIQTAACRHMELRDASDTTLKGRPGTDFTQVETWKMFKTYKKWIFESYLPSVHLGATFPVERVDATFDRYPRKNFLPCQYP